MKTKAVQLPCVAAMPHLDHLAEGGGHAAHAVADVAQRAQLSRGQAARHLVQRLANHGRGQEVDSHQGVAHVGALCGGG